MLNEFGFIRTKKDMLKFLCLVSAAVTSHCSGTNIQDDVPITSKAVVNELDNLEKYANRNNKKCEKTHHPYLYSETCFTDKWLLSKETLLNRGESMFCGAAEAVDSCIEHRKVSPFIYLLSERKRMAVRALLAWSMDRALARSDAPLDDDSLIDILVLQCRMDIVKAVYFLKHGKDWTAKYAGDFFDAIHAPGTDGNATGESAVTAHLRVCTRPVIQEMSQSAAACEEWPRCYETHREEPLFFQFAGLSPILGPVLEETNFDETLDYVDLVHASCMRACGSDIPELEDPHDI